MKSPRRKRQIEHARNAEQIGSLDLVQVQLDHRSCNTKVRFSSKQDARNKLKLTKRLNKSSDGHVYECAVCRGWHVTSMTRDEARSIRRGA